MIHSIITINQQKLITALLNRYVLMSSTWNWTKGGPTKLKSMHCWSGFYPCLLQYSKVHIFWEGHKNMTKSPNFFDILVANFTAPIWYRFDNKFYLEIKAAYQKTHFCSRLSILGVVFVVPVQAAVLSSCLWLKITVEISPK